MVEDEYFKKIIQLLYNHPVFWEVRTSIIHLFFSRGSYNSGCFWRVSIPLIKQFICFKDSSYTLNENKDFLKGCDGEQFTDWGISQRRQLIQFQIVGSSFRNTYSRQYSHQSAIGKTTYPYYKMNVSYQIVLRSPNRLSM